MIGIANDVGKKNMQKDLIKCENVNTQNATIYTIFIYTYYVGCTL